MRATLPECAVSSQQVIKPYGNNSAAHRVANYITLRRTFLLNVAQMILIRARSATVPVCE